ncbi:MAG: hypothetical protein J6O88_09140 [Chryseobacterium sp.]|uniref:hypothetical protein n=1 Tax=Chryseobacterium sp. TaxID=1871047 RepID=UPI001B220FFA|nr:hypothetical protein [Chryseobacterium sp.]MBO6184839.1 hypothetical protein [Chryseobacterium sp.]
MKNLFFACTLFLSSFYYSQVVFEEGYIINKEGEKTVCLIKNYEWKSNPSQLEYKIEGNNSINTIQTSKIKEFSVDNVVYVSANVLIDRSSKNIDKLSTSKNFDNKEEIVLLKNIVDEPISLYRFYDGSVLRFYYKKRDEETFHQLEYKEYLKEGKYILKNEEYKKQLKKEFSDNNKISENDIEKLSYQENDLRKVFLTYNNISTDTSAKKNNLHIYVKPGVGFSRYTISPPIDNTAIGTRKNSSIMLRIAFELEYVLNFNKGKWAVFTEPSFQTVNHKIEDYNRRNFEVKYASIQIPIGIKHTMFVNSKSKLYISGALYSDIPLNSNFFIDGHMSGTIINKLYHTIVIGYNYDKFGVELKYGVTPDFSTSYYGYQSDLGMNGFNVSLNYKLF